MSQRFVGIALLLLATRAAGATSLSDEVTVGTRGFLSNALTVSLEFGDSYSVDLSYGLSKSSGQGLTHVGALAGGILLGDHWLVLATFKASPATPNALTICLPGSGCAPGEERLSLLAPGLVAAYESAGDRDFEWGADLSTSAAFYGLKYTLNPGQPNAPSRAVSLQQLRLGLAVTGHLYDRFDVGARGAVYRFGSSVDPVLLGRVLAVTVGGLPLAPLSWEAGPTAAVAFTKKLRLSLAGTFGRYADPCNGNTALATATLTGRPGPLRLWGSATVQVDRPPDPKTVAACADQLTPALTAASVSVFASAGVGYTF